MRGKAIIISTGQRATFGLTLALSRVVVRHPHRHICDKVEGDSGRGNNEYFKRSWVTSRYNDFSYGTLPHVRPFSRRRSRP